MDKKMLKILQSKKQDAYDNPVSVLKEFDAFLECNGIYRSFNENQFIKQIKNQKELLNFTLMSYSKATLDNEREFLLYCLFHMGYDKSILAKMVLDIFQFEKNNSYLWHYADYLYSIKAYSFLDDYIRLIMDKSYGQSREMLVLLVGESKTSSVIPYLLELAHDDEILGHTLIALSNFKDPDIISLMKKHISHPQKWVANIAKSYVSTH